MNPGDMDNAQLRAYYEKQLEEKDKQLEEQAEKAERDKEAALKEQAQKAENDIIDIRYSIFLEERERRTLFWNYRRSFGSQRIGTMTILSGSPQEHPVGCLREVIITTGIICKWLGDRHQRLLDVPPLGASLTEDLHGMLCELLYALADSVPSDGTHLAAKVDVHAAIQGQCVKQYYNLACVSGPKHGESC